MWVVTPKTMQARLVTRNPTPRVTTHYQLEHMYTHAIAVYRLCARPAGDVEVLPLIPVLGMHHATLDAVERWRYALADATTCTVQSFSADVLMTRQPH